MTLAKYKQKRHFDKTPEPRGKTAASGAQLRFVVQKHAASRLHYDFRLELGGVLKSWAVPKGPSLNPADKRLAVMVEDHPLDYRTFEGTIQAGNYGAGTVMVWDQGTYVSSTAPDRRSSDKALREGLAKGHLSIVLNGTKLKGEFSLVRLKRGKEHDWLLIKKQDEWASVGDITEADRSATSGRNLQEIAGNVVATVKKPGKTARSKKATASRSKGGKNAMPHSVKPMLATLVDEAFNRKGWQFEIKWDGYRAIAEVHEGNVLLYSRNQNSLTERFQPVTTSLAQLGHDAVLDGEVVVVDENGKSHFQLLQNYQKTGSGCLLYYVFDLLYLDGRDLRQEPLRLRQQLLEKLIRKLPHVAMSEHVEEKGVEFFAAAVERGLEGIIAKNRESTYQEGRRGLDWLKIKTRARQEAVIGGFTEPRGSRKSLGALLLGVYEGDDLVYIGHTGGGFGRQGLTDLREQLQPMVQKRCPFKTTPKPNAPVHWVKPQLVCEVEFQEWTGDGIMRQPIFVGLREDKPVRSVYREQPKSIETKPAVEVPDDFLTHLDKVYWPEEGYNKADLIAYYREIAQVILPYLHDRPLSLHRHPNGITGKSFFQKDVARQPPPSWVRTVTLAAESRGTQVQYALCQDEQSLLYLANLGCIELNPWNSRVDSIDEPDYLVIDLDPENVGFDKVIQTAVAVRKVLEKADVVSVCKTSGKRGLHIFVPLQPGYSTDQATQFARIIATIVNEKLPEFTSIVRSPAQRQGRVYLDFLQNRRGQTLACAYSVRPYPGATVSTPLAWTEVKKGLNPSKWTIKTIMKRLDKVGDLWQPVLDSGNDLAACLYRLDSMRPTS